MSDEELLRRPPCCPVRRERSPTPFASYRDTYGVSYLIVQDKHAEAFSKVIAELR